MAKIVVPLRPLPNQTLQIQLGGQACTLNVYTGIGYAGAPALFMDVLVGTTLIIAGVLCENLNRIVRSLYLGFSGDFVFADTQSVLGVDGADPQYLGLGAQFVLLYIPASELPAGQG